jgi:hypothetical protein
VAALDGLSVDFPAFSTARFVVSTSTIWSVGKSFFCWLSFYAISYFSRHDYHTPNIILLQSSQRDGISPNTFPRI